MTESHFVRERTEDWKILESMATTRFPKDFESIARFFRLYRQAAGHLSYAQTHFPSSDTCLYLTDLVARAHHRLYAKQGDGPGRFFQLLARGFPHSVRSNRRFVLCAVGLFVFFGLYGYLFCLLSPDSASAFIPVQYLDAGSSGEGGAAQIAGSVLSGLIMVNNVRVAVMALGLGITLGLGTAYILAYNAMFLGAFAAYMSGRMGSLLFWSLILPHGIFELFAICLSGAAGLRIGYALLRPGSLRRSDALVDAGRKTLPLMGFVTVLLIVAALIEGFFTPSALPPTVKLLFAGLLAAVLIFYLLYKKQEAGGA